MFDLTWFTWLQCHPFFMIYSAREVNENHRKLLSHSSKISSQYLANGFDFQWICLILPICVYCFLGLRAMNHQSKHSEFGFVSLLIVSFIKMLCLFFMKWMKKSKRVYLLFLPNYCLKLWTQKLKCWPNFAAFKYWCIFHSL